MLHPLIRLFAVLSAFTALCFSGPAAGLPAPALAHTASAAANSSPLALDDSSRTLVYVAIGASDAVGVGVPDPATQGWVPRFATLLGAHVHVVNLGVAGITMHRALPVDLPVALDAHPDVVTVWLAVNDVLAGVSLAHYRADLHALLQGLRAGSRRRILVGNIPDLALAPAAARRLGTSPRSRITAWNAVIAAETRAAGATLVDLFRGWRELAAHPEYVGSDGFHPSVEGYARLAQLFAAAL